MANPNDLNILISAQLNIGKSIGSINTQIQALQKKIDKIDLKFEVDPHTITTLNKFSDSLNKFKILQQEQNKVVQQNETIVKKADGTTEKFTEQILKNGEIIQKSRKVIDEKTNSIKKETGEVGRLIDELDDLGEKQKEITRLNQKLDVTGTTSVFKNGNVDTTVSLDPNANIKSVKIVDNIAKEIEETEKLKLAKASLRKEILSLAQVGVLSTKQLQELARATNRSQDLTQIEQAKSKYTELLGIQKELMNVEQAKYKVNKDKQKELADEKAKSEQLEHQLSLYKQQAALNVQNARRRYDGLIDTNELDKYTDKVNKLAVDTPNLKREMDNLSLGFKKIEMNAKTASGAIDVSNKSAISLGEAIKTAAIKFPLWVGISTLFYGSARALQSMLTTIVEIDTQMTELKRVMDEDTNFNRMLEESIDLSGELGKSLKDVNEAMIGFARMGFNDNQILALTKAATVASNVSELTSAEAMENLTSIMVQFNVEAEKSIEIIDRLNEVDNNFAITTKNISDALAKSGSTAQTFGVSLDRTIGYITAIGVATRESGDVIGNSLKSIFSRLTTNQSSVDSLKKINIEVKDASGNMKDASLILDELAGKWSGLSKEQQQNLGVTIAGRYQLSRFFALMRNYQMALDATETSLNSQGSAIRENQKYLESLEAKINKLQASWSELALTIGDSGVKSLFDSLIVNLTSLTRGFTEITDATNGWNLKLPLLALGIFGAIKAITALRASLTGLKLSMGWIGVALVGIELLTTTFVGMAKASSKNVDSLIENANAMEQTSDKINQLIDKYEELKPIANEDTKAQEELRSVMEELHNLAPQLTGEIDNQGNSFELNADKARQYANSLKGLSEEQINIAKSKLEIALITSKEDLVKEEESLKKMQKDFEDYQKRITEIQKIYGIERVDNLKDELMQVIKNEERSQLERKNAYSYYLEVEKLFERSTSKEYEEQETLVKNKREEINLIEDKIDSLNGLTKVTELNTNVVSENADVLDEVSDSTEQQVSLIGDYLDSVSDLTSALKSLNEGEELSLETILNLIDKYPDLISSLVMENGQLKLNKDAIELLMRTEEESFKNKLEMQKIELQNQQKYLAEKLKAYGIEIQAIKHLNDTKKILLANTLKYTNADGLMGRNDENIKAYQEGLEMLNKWNDIQKEINGISTLQSANFTQQISKPSSSKSSSQKEEYLSNLEVRYRKLEETITQLNNTIDTNDKKLSMAENESDKITILSDQIRLYEELQKQLHALNQERRKEREEIVNDLRSLGFDIKIENDQAYISNLDLIKKLTGDTAKESDNLIKKLWSLDDAIDSSGQSWIDYQSKISNTNNEIESLYDTIQKQYDEWLDNTKQVANDVISTMKDVYKKQRDLAIAAKDQELKNLDDTYRAKMEYLDDELDKYTEIINAKLKLIDEEANEEDYLKNLTQAQQEAQDLQNRINILSLDDSIESRAKREELEEQLAKKKEEILDMQLSHERDLRKENLQDQLDNYEKEIEAKKDAETDKYDSMKDRLEKEKQEIQYYYDELLNNERYWSNVREDIVNGNLNNLQNSLQGFLDGFRSYNEQVVRDLGLSWQELLNLIDQVNTSSGSLGDINYNQGSSLNEASIIAKMKKNSAAWHDASESERKRLEEENRQLGQSIGATYNSSSGTWWKNGKRLYHKGGIVGNIPTSNIGNIVDKLFNTDANEIVIKALKGELMIPQQNIMQNFIPNMNRLFTSVQQPSMSTPTIYNLNLNIESLTGDKNGGQVVFKEIVDGLKKMGRR